MLEIVRHINTFFKGTLASGSDAQLLLMPCLGQDSMVPINVYRSPPFDNYGSDKSGLIMLYVFVVVGWYLNCDTVIQVHYIVKMEVCLPSTMRTK